MKQYRRKTNRLKNYNYSQNGIYFITICTQNREPLLSKIVVGDDDSASLDNTTHVSSIILTKYGIIAEKYIHTMQHHAANVRIAKYVIMPDHIHLLIELIAPPNNTNDIHSGAPRSSPPTPTKHTIIPQLIASFKRFTNKEIGFNLWQRSYHDHIIRDEQDYYNTWQYIENNPAQWIQKCFT